MSSHEENANHTWQEKIEVGSAEVLNTIKKLLKQANVHKITIKSPTGKKLLTIPATAGAAVGGVAVLTAPLFSAILAITALLTNVTLVIERTDSYWDAEVVEDQESEDSDGDSQDHGEAH